MVCYLKFLARVAKHKALVLRFGRRTGAPLWALLVHDWTKLTPAAFGTYARYFYGERTPAVRRAFHGIVRLHTLRNPHHWEYWGVRPMPELAVREMLADWLAATTYYHHKTPTSVASWGWLVHQASTRRIMLNRITVSRLVLACEDFFGPLSEVDVQVLEQLMGPWRVKEHEATRRKVVWGIHAGTA